MVHLPFIDIIPYVGTHFKYLLMQMLPRSRAAPTNISSGQYKQLHLKNDSQYPPPEHLYLLANASASGRLEKCRSSIMLLSNMSTSITITLKNGTYTIMGSPSFYMILCVICRRSGSRSSRPL